MSGMDRTPDRFVHETVPSGGGGGGGAVTQGTTPWVVSGTVVATQGTSPWVVSGTVAVTGTQTDGLTDAELRASPVPVSGTVAATQSTSPWVVSGTVAATQSGAWAVSVSNFPATVAVTQSTSPWVVSNTVLTDAHDDPNNAIRVNVVATTGGGLTDAELRATPVPVSGTVTANQGTSPWVVSATDLDIRDLTFAADKVDASGTVLGAGTNNIGDVDVASLPTFGAGQATYTEDTAHTTGDRGSFVLGVRNSNQVALTSTDLDYSPIAVDSIGAVFVRPNSTAQWVIAGSQTEDNTASGGDEGVFALAVRNDSDAARTDADGDYSAISVDSTGRVKLAAGTTRIGGTYSVNGQIIDENGVVCTVKRAPIALTAAGNGNTTVVAAVTGKMIRVLGIHISCNDGANHVANFTDGAGGASIFPFLVATVPLSHNFAPTTGAWLCETTAATALVLNLSENVTFLHGVVIYIEV